MHLDQNNGSMALPDLKELQELRIPEHRWLISKEFCMKHFQEYIGKKSQRSRSFGYTLWTGIFECIGEYSGVFIDEAVLFEIYILGQR